MALQHSKLSQITEITLDLHFDNLQSFFVPVDQVANARAAVTNRLSSKRFGPGFYISAVRNVPKSNTPQLGLYVRSEEGLPTISVNFSYAWQAISGHTYPWSPPTKLQTVTGGGEGRGIASILLRGSQAFQALVMGDNKGICCISMTYDMKDLAMSSSSLDILHSTLVRRMQVDTSKFKIVEFIANKRREASDGSHVVEPKILSIVTKAVLEAAGCSWDEFVQRGIDASLWYPVNDGSLRAQDPLGRFDHDSDAEDAVVIALDEGPRNPGHSVPGARVNEIKMEPVDDPDEIRVTPLPEDEATQVAPEEEESPAKLRLFRANPTTMEAVLYWVITGRISFKPLRKAARGVPADAASRHRPASASCKSVYRIARILGFKALETIALTYYEAQLSKSDTNVLDELFGPMAAQYVDLKNLALLAVVKRWDQLKNSPALAQKMTEITSGRFPSAGQIMAELWAKVSAVAEKVPAVQENELEREISPVAPMRMVRRRAVRRISQSS